MTIAVEFLWVVLRFSLPHTQRPPHASRHVWHGASSKRLSPPATIPGRVMIDSAWSDLMMVRRGSIQNTLSAPVLHAEDCPFQHGVDDLLRGHQRRRRAFWRST